LSTDTKRATTPQRRLTAAARRGVIERAATAVFAERGYRGASMDEIARRSGVTVPVVYDHFESKGELHRRLLERHFAELRELWRQHLAAAGTTEERLHRSIDAWFSYVQSHPYASRMLFRDTTGEANLKAMHDEVAAQSRALLLPLVEQEAGVGHFVTGGDEDLEMVWEVWRSVLQGLALWWQEHQEVPRDRVVAAALNALWIGFERVQDGETWPG
jgi:AcrR family transcriptional regulator